MKTDDIKELGKLENRHWWHISKKECIVAAVKKYSAQEGEVLEIGAGSGNVLTSMKFLGKLTALDPSETALQLCRQKGVDNLIQSTFENYSPESGKYSVVIAADVLEHIEDDQKAVIKIHNILKPGGLAVIHVPAIKLLYSYWDKRLGHYRRYTKSELVDLFKNAGFNINYYSYRLSFIALPAIIYRKLAGTMESAPGNDKKSDFDSFPALNGVLLNFARIETALMIKYGLISPFGLSMLLIAEKKA